jgi:hypothetical protein
MAQNESRLVFVVGVVRSGTSLLFSMLNQHSHLGLMYECDVWDFPASLSRLRFCGQWLERQEFYNGVLSRHQLIFGGRLRGLEQVKTPEDLYRVFGEGKGATLWGEKSPFYGTRLRRLAKRFPEASFILLWRDPVEIYRSVEQAGRRSRFFRRRGMLSRLIFHQEEMIRQGGELSCKGLRLHHVNYHELVDDPERVSRELCLFLKIPFEPAMLDLSNADFSSIYQGQHHEHLRRGLIERQSRKPVKMNPAVVDVLQRFEGRWERLKGQWFGFAHKSSREPGGFELLYRRVSGRFFCALDDCKRSLFEFLPLTWLQSYRRLKLWYLAGRPVVSAERPSIWQECQQHYKTLLASLATLAAVAGLDFITGPRVSVAPFYLIPAGILALRMGLRWATWVSVICAVLWSFIPQSRDAHHDWTLLLWNSWMHFLVCQTVAVLLARVRSETPVRGEAADAASTVASKAPAPTSEPSNAQP